MLCDVCHKNGATVHLTEIVNDKVVEMHICQACAKSKAQELKEQLSISNFLDGLAGRGEIIQEEAALKCPVCALTYVEFRKQGRLGCGVCYAAFKDKLVPLLKKIHGASRHTGKAPWQAAKGMVSRIEVVELKKKLEKVIAREQYEEAARLRDELKKLDQRPKTEDQGSAYV